MSPGWLGSQLGVFSPLTLPVLKDAIGAGTWVETEPTPHSHESHMSPLTQVRESAGLRSLLGGPCAGVKLWSTVWVGPLLPGDLSSRGTLSCSCQAPGDQGLGSRCPNSQSP